MSTLTLTLTTPTATYSLSRIASFTLEKDVYTPYSSLSLTAYSSLSNLSPESISRVALSLDNTTLHLGTLSTLTTARQNGISRLTLTSKSLCALLLQNQLTPGRLSPVSLNSLLSDYVNLPSEITWEQNDNSDNYLYVKDNTSLWDGISHLCYKIAERYPFIRADNEIRFTLPDAYSTYVNTSLSTLTSYGTTVDDSLLYSDFSMADADGSYGAFTRHSSLADSLGIVRTKVIPFDMQYLYDPDKALAYREAFALRRRVRRFAAFPGLSTLSLGDRMTIGDLCEDAPICRVRLTGDAKGTFTRLETYEDAFFG